MRESQRSSAHIEGQQPTQIEELDPSSLIRPTALDAKNENDQSQPDIDFDGEMDYIRRLKEKLTQNQNLSRLSQSNNVSSLPKSTIHDFNKHDNFDAEEEDNDDTQEMLEDSRRSLGRPAGGDKAVGERDSIVEVNHDFLQGLDYQTQGQSDCPTEAVQPAPK